MKLRTLRSQLHKADPFWNHNKVHIYCERFGNMFSHHARWTDKAEKFEFIVDNKLDIIKPKKEILSFIDSWISRYGPEATIQDVLRNTRKKPDSQPDQGSGGEGQQNGASDSSSQQSQSQARQNRKTGSSGRSTRGSRGGKPGQKASKGLRPGNRARASSRRNPTRSSSSRKHSAASASSSGNQQGSGKGISTSNKLGKFPTGLEGTGALRDHPAGICATTADVSHLRRNKLASKCSSLVKRLIQGQDVAISETKGTVSGKKLMKELTTRRCRLDSIHKKNRAKKDILILVDVSPSCSSNCKESLATATQIVKDFRGRAQLVVHSNGWPVELAGNRLDPDSMPDYYGRSTSKDVAEWVQTYNWGLILVLGDSDVLWLLKELDDPQTRMIWLDRPGAGVNRSYIWQAELPHCEHFVGVYNVHDTVTALKKLR